MAGTGVKKKLVIGNWKMHGALHSNRALLESLRDCWRPSHAVEMVVCPPAVYLAQVQSTLQDSAVAWGAQDLSDQQQGAFTGELSARMLHEFGCTHVLVGHSERRTRLQEQPEQVAAKAVAGISAGLTTVVCLGESAAERADGATLDVLAQHLQAVLSRLPVAAGGLDRLVLAYEPLWAIGTGQHASAAVAQEVHAALRSMLVEIDPVAAQGVRILYGGSVKATNAAEYAAQRDIDGVLVGGASLQAAEFLEIGAAFLPAS